MAMRIFLAGASGVIGQRLIPRLVQAGHVVGGMTRSASKTELLRHLGAQPIICDVFDREALIQAVRDFKPDVILNELTDLPDDVTQISEHADLNARIRTEGNQNLIDAARHLQFVLAHASTISTRSRTVQKLFVTPAARGTFISVCP